MCHVNFRPTAGGRLVYSAPCTPDIRATIPDHVKPSPEYLQFLERLQQEPAIHNTLTPELLACLDPEVVMTFQFKGDSRGMGHSMQVRERPTHGGQVVSRCAHVPYKRLAHTLMLYRCSPMARRTTLAMTWRLCRRAFAGWSWMGHRRRWGWHCQQPQIQRARQWSAPRGMCGRWKRGRRRRSR